MQVKIGSKVMKNRSKIEIKPKVTPKREKKPLENIIPFPKEEKEDVLDWSIPTKSLKQQTTHRTLVRIFISIAGALLVGTIMGCCVLSLFFSNSVHSTNTIGSHLSAPIEKKPQSQNGAYSKPVVPVKTTKLAYSALPTLSVFLLQAGNYHSKSSAAKVADEYRTKGLAAVMSERSPYRIYLGIASKKADAKKLANSFKAKGVLVYVKEVKLQATGKTAANFVATLKAGNQLFTELEGQSIAKLVQKDKIKIAAKTLLRKQQNFMRVSKVPANDPESMKVAMLELERGLDQAVQGMIEYSQHPNEALVWFVQEGLVHYENAYEQLCYAVSQNQ